MFNYDLTRLTATGKGKLVEQTITSMSLIKIITEMCIRSNKLGVRGRSCTWSVKCKSNNVSHDTMIMETFRKTSTDIYEKNSPTR